MAASQANGVPPVARAETVGSLLRPAYLLEAREARRAGALSDADLRAVEDRAVTEAIDLQQSVGLDVISDGEHRRLSWMSTVNIVQDTTRPSPLGGFSYHESTRASFMTFWRDDRGQVVRRMSAPRAFITEPLHGQRDVVASEYPFLKAHATRRTKYAFPAPSYHRVFWHPDYSREAYPTVDEFLVAVRDYLREHVVQPLLDLGCDYIQLDAPNYGQFYVDTEVRAALEADGHDLRAELIADAEIDNSLFEGVKGVTRALHVCRGNGPGGIWSASGGYEPIARDAFERFSNLDTLLLEYDTDRAGDFAPLRHVRGDNNVVLGLLTTKHGELEDTASIEARINGASQYVPLQRLALSPQCGFNSASQGNRLSAEEQIAKLRRVVDVAHAVWG
ncbi:MAG: cobalamin-independent methionine synthase II family protein [Chloroflexi bacterium]|nr:cobalamin-independent methionine synthase II family protein [Chloroflexota bacterium]